MKQSIFQRMVYGNVGINICVYFTIVTMLDLVLSSLQGVWETSYWHLGMRLILCAGAALTLFVFRCFKQLSILVVLALHFSTCILMMILWTWINGFFMELHPDAYFYAVRTIVIAYPVVIVGALIIDGIRTAKANRILKQNWQSAE